MDLLNLLSNLLSDSVRNTPISMSRNTDIDDVLDGLKQRARQGTSNHVPHDLQVEAVKKFWDTGEFKTFREARLVSFSLAVRPWNDRRCLIEEPARFSSVLTELGHWETSPRQFRKCYQGLMHSYFHYYGAYKLDLDGNAVSMTGQKNWGALRTYLNEKANHIQDATINPDWVGCLLENKGIFSATPCDAYADDVLNGRNGKVLQIREHLGITNASWFTRSLVLTQIEKVCKQRDMLFLSKVDQLMALLGDNTVLRNLGLQMILNRYAQTIDRPPHHKLKDYSVTAWDNPWLSSADTQWDGVSSEAREMVGDWLKEECIELFFTKLVQDAKESGQGENNKSLRRLAFWKSFIPQIKKIRFALGSHARDPWERDFVELREKIKGLDVDLQDSNRFNNALIMTFGDLVAVEFSGESNAFYGYSLRRTLPFDLGKPVRTAPVNGKNSLKNDACVLRLGHQDNILGHRRWESRFRDELYSNFGLVGALTTKPKTDAQKAAVPDKEAAVVIEKETPIAIPTLSTTITPPSYRSDAATSQRVLDFRARISSPQKTDESPRTPIVKETSPAIKSSPLDLSDDLDGIRELAKRFNATVVDHRPKGGALWVVMGEHPNARRTLSNWGFNYVKGKGWWKKDQQ